MGQSVMVPHNADESDTMSGDMRAVENPVTVHRRRAGLMCAAAITTMALIPAGAVDADDGESSQPTLQVKPPAQQIEIRKEDKGDPAGAITPSDLKDNKAVSPSKLKENEAISPSDLKGNQPTTPGTKLPAVQKEAPTRLKEGSVTPKLNEELAPKLKGQVAPRLKEQTTPEIEKTLPSAPKNAQPAAGWPEITRLSRDRAEQGHRIRIEGRHFGPDQGGRELLIEHRATEKQVELSVLRWADDEIHVRIPATAWPGLSLIGMRRADGGWFVHARADFEVVQADRSLGTAGADLDRADVADEASSGGGFSRRVTEELQETLDAPELFIRDIEWEREIFRTYGLYYGDRETVHITVANAGDEEAAFRGAYQIERQRPDATDVMRIGPGEEKRVPMQVDLTPSLSPAAKSTIAREHELSIRFFVADPRNSNNLYRDGDMENHAEVRDVSVRSDLVVEVTLDRIRQHGLCENFAEKRDWMFMIATDDGSYFTHELGEDDRPASLGEGRVRSESAISPAVRYRLDANHRTDVSTNPWLFALKNNGRIKNTGRGAEFPLSGNVDDLFARGTTTRWIRSSDRGGSFCGTNLEVRARLEARIRPYEG